MDDSASVTIVSGLQRELAALEAINTADDALDAATRTSALRAAINAARMGVEAQNTAAELHIRAERRLGQILAQTVRAGRGGNRLPDGVTADQSSRAQRLARIPDDELDAYIDNARTRNKPISLAGAMKLAPRKKPQARTSQAHAYAAPPIDVELARAYGLDAADARADIIDAALHTALRSLKNPKHRTVWMLAHGVHEDGSMGEPWTTSRIAAHHGVSDPYVARLLSDASVHILEHLLVTAMDEWAKWMSMAQS